MNRCILANASFHSFIHVSGRMKVQKSDVHKIACSLITSTSYQSTVLLVFKNSNSA